MMENFRTAFADIMFWTVFLLLAKAIDEYASLKSKGFKSNDEVLVDPRLEAIVERMLDKYANLYFFPFYIMYCPTCLSVLFL